MKINPKHNKIVEIATRELRNALVGQTIELMKLIGAKTCEDVVFDKVLILHQQRKNGQTETILAGRIWYNDSGQIPFYLLELDGVYHTSFFLSISNMQLIYGEVYKLARKH